MASSCNVCYIPYSILNYIIGGDVQNANSRIESIEVEPSNIERIIHERNCDDNINEYINDNDSNKDKSSTGGSDDSTIDNHVGESGKNKSNSNSQRPSFNEAISDLTMEGTEGITPAPDTNTSIASISSNSSPIKDVDYARRKSSLATVTTMLDETQLLSRDVFIRDLVLEVTEIESKAALHDASNNPESLLGWQVWLSCYIMMYIYVNTICELCLLFIDLLIFNYFIVAM